MKDRKIQYSPKATPYMFTVQIEDAELTNKLDEVWDRDKDKLSKLYKGKKKKGGKTDPAKARKAIEKAIGFPRIYNQDLALWGKALIEEEFDKVILLVNYVNLIEDNNPDAPLIEMEVYLYPEAKLSEQQKQTLKNLTIPKKDLPTEEDQLKGRIRELQAQHMVRTPVEVVSEDCEVVFDVYTSIDGVRYENGCAKLRRANLKDIIPVELKAAVTGAEKGAKVTVEFENTDEDQYKGKTVTAEVSIQDVNKLDKMDPESDDLYMKAGFDNKIAFEEKFKKEYEDYTSNALEQYVMSSVIEYIMQNSDLEPIPERFIEVSMNNFMGQNSQADEQTRQYVYQQILRQLVDTMCLNAYIDTHELGRGIDHKDLVKHMLETVKFDGKTDE